MRSTQAGSISKKAAAALVVMGALALQPLGTQAADPPIRGLLKSAGAGANNYSCEWQFTSCGSFVGIQSVGVFHPDRCFNNNANLPRENIDVRKEIFGADPQGNPADEGWGGKYPSLNIKDVSKYTDKAARTVKFTLDDGDGFHSDDQHYLFIYLYNADCESTGDHAMRGIVVGETRTVTIPRRTKWFVLYAGNLLGGPQRIHINEKWHMIFQ